MQAMLYTQNQLNWSDGPIETLGVSIDCNTCQHHPTDLKKIFSQICQTCESWLNRKQTLCGKVLILNTLICSLFVYKLMVTLYLTKKAIQEVDKIFREFLWNGK